MGEIAAWMYVSSRIDRVETGSNNRFSNDFEREGKFPAIRTTRRVAVWMLGGRRTWWEAG
jgi:hypothetical protein